MPGNLIHGNGLPATFVPGRRNVCEGYWAVDESLKKSLTRFSFPLLLKRKKYFTDPSCLPHWQRKTSPRSTALVSRIGLQPFLRTRSFVPDRRNVCEGHWAVDKSSKNHSLLFSFAKKYFTNPSCLPHWQRKTSPRSTALVSRIGLQSFLRTRWYPALVPCSATAVEADFGVRPKVRQNMRQVLKRTQSLIVPKTSHTRSLGSADAAEK